MSTLFVLPRSILRLQSTSAPRSDHIFFRHRRLVLAHNDPILSPKTFAYSRHNLDLQLRFNHLLIFNLDKVQGPEWKFGLTTKLRKSDEALWTNGYQMVVYFSSDGTFCPKSDPIFKRPGPACCHGKINIWTKIKGFLCSSGSQSLLQFDENVYKAQTRHIMVIFVLIWTEALISCQFFVCQHM